MHIFHKWTNWSDPKVTKPKFALEYTEPFQQRKCLVCNMIDKRLLRARSGS